MDSLSLLEKRAFVTRLALARVREILTFPLPRADDVSIAAQEEQELQLRAAQSALAEARRADPQPQADLHVTSALQSVATREASRCYCLDVWLIRMRLISR